MIDNIEELACPHAVGATGETAYALITVYNKGWWLCVNDDGTPFLLARDASDDDEH